MNPVWVRIADVPWMSLPSRRAREVLSGRTVGAEGCSVRFVEIAPADPSAPRRPHMHPTYEEIILVMEGKGFTSVDGQWWPVAEGEAILIPAGAVHSTVNPGPGLLRLICFFASAYPENDWIDYPDIELTGWDDQSSERETP